MTALFFRSEPAPRNTLAWSGFAAFRGAGSDHAGGIYRESRQRLRNWWIRCPVSFARRPTGRDLCPTCGRVVQTWCLHVRARMGRTRYVTLEHSVCGRMGAGFRAIQPKYGGIAVQRQIEGVDTVDFIRLQSRVLNRAFLKTV